MRTFILLALILLATLTPAPAQDKLLDRFKPKEPTPLARDKELRPETPTPAALPPPSDAGAGLKARGIVFISALPQFNAGGVPAMDGVKTAGVPLIDNPAFRTRISKFFGRPVSMELVEAVAQETISYYKEHDRPVMRVAAPEQDVTSGVLQFLVTEGHVGQISVTGNRWFKSSLYKVRVKPGESILMSRLEADTAFMERNPFRSATAEISPGKNPGETDITLRAQDKFPLRAFVGYDDTGVQSTGRNRFFGGFNWGNVFGIGHQLSYQFTTSDDFEQLLAHSGTYTAPLPWNHILQLIGTYADSNPKLEDEFDLTGQSWQTGLRYIVPLPSIKKYKHELTLGYDFKFTNNNLQFGGEEVFNTPIEISEFSLGYSASLPDKWGRTGIALTGFWSPGGMGSDNNDETFDAARKGSKAEYFYAMAGLDRITKLPLGMTWALSIKGQLSNGNLQATEQFLLGGQSTVRGYNELISSGDQGILVRNEIYSPPFSLMKLVHLRSVQDQLQFLVFHDYGYSEVKDTIEGESSGTELQSCGVGLRWQVRDNVTVRFDYGWQLNDVGLDISSRAHVGVTISF